MKPDLGKKSMHLGTSSCQEFIHHTQFSIYAFCRDIAIGIRNHFLHAPTLLSDKVLWFSFEQKDKASPTIQQEKPCLYHLQSV